MKIQKTTETNKVRYELVEAGVCFSMGDKLYMKTDENSAINLATGVISNIDDEAVILKPDAFVTV